MPRVGRLNPERRKQKKKEAMNAENPLRQEPLQEAWADLASASEFSWQPEEEGTSKQFPEYLQEELVKLSASERASWLKASLKRMLQEQDREFSEKAVSFRQKQCQIKTFQLWALASLVSARNKKRTLENCLRDVFKLWKNLTHNETFKQQLQILTLQEAVQRLAEENGKLQEAVQRQAEHSEHLKQMVDQKDAAQTEARTEDKRLLQEEILCNTMSLETKLKKQFIHVGRILFAIEDFETSGKDHFKKDDKGSVTDVYFCTTENTASFDVRWDRTQLVTSTPVSQWSEWFQMLPEA
jgi:hypothetical protein